MRLMWLALLPSVLPAQSAMAAESIQEVLLRVKPAVALVLAEVSAEVTLRCVNGERRVTPTFRETGSGWFLHPSGWLVTNGHVVSPAHQSPAWLREQLLKKAERPGCRVDHVVFSPSISVILSNGAHFAATVAKYTQPVTSDAMAGRDLALLKLQAVDLPTLPLGDSAAMKIGDRLHILGFPRGVLNHELLDVSAQVEASITSGAISGFQQDRTGQSVIQTDAPAALGNSGGPAVDDRGRVVGVVTFASRGAGEQGTTAQGFNFIIPSQAVKDFLSDTGIALGHPGRFTAAWRAGLRRFFDGDYVGAEGDLAEAARLIPNLPDVTRLATENAERLKSATPRAFPWVGVGLGVVAAGLAAYASLLGLRHRRNRFRIRPDEVVKLMESDHPPVILDVRDAATYEKSPVRILDARHLTPDTLERGGSVLDIDTDRMVVAYCT